MVLVLVLVRARILEYYHTIILVARPGVPAHRMSGCLWVSQGLSVVVVLYGISAVSWLAFLVFDSKASYSACVKLRVFDFIVSPWLPRFGHVFSQ